MKKRILTTVCQRPERASLISTIQYEEFGDSENIGCQRPERASLISTYEGGTVYETQKCVNALNGLL